VKNLIIKNPEIVSGPYTVLASDVAASATSLVCEDATLFAANNLILVGGVGNEKAEDTNLTGTPTDNLTMVVTAVKFNHLADESVELLPWNRYQIQYKTSVDGEWQDLVTEGFFDWGGIETTYQHTTGSDDYYYRSRYMNSVTTTYSAYTESLVGTGLSRNQLGAMIERVRKDSKDENQETASDQDITADVNEAQDIVGAMNRNWWFLLTSYDYTTEADSNTFTLPTNLRRAKRLLYNLVDGSTDTSYYLRYIPDIRFQYKYGDNGASTDDNLVEYTVDEASGVIKVGPTPTTADLTLTLIYWAKLTDLVDYGDTTLVPLPQVLTTYATAQNWLRKGNTSEYEAWMKKFETAIRLLENMRVRGPTPQNLSIYQGRHPRLRYMGNSSAYDEEGRINYY